MTHDSWGGHGSGEGKSAPRSPEMKEGFRPSEPALARPQGYA